MYIYIGRCVCVCDLLIFLQNRLNVNRIPYYFPRSAYSTCRLLRGVLAFTR